VRVGLGPQPAETRAKKATKRNTPTFLQARLTIPINYYPLYAFYGKVRQHNGGLVDPQDYKLTNK
jgi:hypothetical protein